MFDPRDTGWRRAVWFAAVGAIVGGPLGYLIARLSGTGEFGWPASMALLVANVGAQLPRPGRLLGLVIGTVGAIVYLACAIFGYAAILGHVGRYYARTLAYNDPAFWGIAVACGTVSALLIAWWITREQRMW